MIANENVIGSYKGHKIPHVPYHNFDSKIMLHLLGCLSIFFPGSGEGLARPVVPPMLSKNTLTAF